MTLVTLMKKDIYKNDQKKDKGKGVRADPYSMLQQCERVVVVSIQI